MDSFFNFIIKTSNFLGFDISNKFQANFYMRTALSIYKAIIFVLLLLAVVQNSLNAFLKSFETFGDLRSAASATFGIRGLLMNIFLIKNFEKIGELIEKMKNPSWNIQEDDKNLAIFKKARKIGITIFVVNILSIWAYFIGGYIEIIVCFFTGQKPRREIVFSFEMYWPFDPTDYLPWTLYWFSLALHYWQWSCCFINLVTLYISVYLTGCFNNLQMEITEIINGCDSRSASETKKMFANFIDKHNEVMNYTQELISLIGFPILIFMGEASFMICFLGFSAIFDDRSLMLINIVALTNHLADVLIMFWASDNLKQSSQGIVDSIAASDFYNLDVQFKKELILILRMANKPKKLSGFGFFNLELKNYTKVITTAYSYFTLMKQFY